MTLGMALSGFHHHKRLTIMVRRDGDLGVRQGRLVQVNPFHTKKLKELQRNSPSKTERKDPKVITDMIELGHALAVIIPEGTARDA
jgi:hypothetical protein